MRLGSLFSGIGGLELGLERAGLGEVVWQVEIDPFCRRVLEKHWPNAQRFNDVRSVGAATLPAVDVICGGFPCQDVSLAGKRRGLDGERSGLWFEYRRIVEETQPSAVIIENVLGLRTSGLSRVLADLASLGFDAEWSDIAACDAGAPHQRRRIFIVATHPDRIHLWSEPGWLERACRSCATEHRSDLEVGVAPNADGMRRLQQAWGIANQRGWTQHCGWELGDIARMDDGIPEGMDLAAARKALGNAVVVPCAEVIGRTLMAAIGAENPEALQVVVK